MLFLEDGRLELDTNTVERAIRPISLGRKNALFAGSDGGACWWAIVASLVATAKLNGVEPLAWLTDVLERVVSGRTKAHELERPALELEGRPSRRHLMRMACGREVRCSTIRRRPRGWWRP